MGGVTLPLSCLILARELEGAEPGSFDSWLARTGFIMRLHHCPGPSIWLNYFCGQLLHSTTPHLCISAPGVVAAETFLFMLKVLPILWHIKFFIRLLFDVVIEPISRNIP